MKSEWWIAGAALLPACVSESRPMRVATDPVLGDIVVDPRGAHTTEIFRRGRRITVHLMVDKGQPPTRWIVHARSAVQRLDDLEPAATAAAAEGLVEMANVWRENPEDPEYTPADLPARFRLETLSVFEGGTIEFLFDDGGVFAGHTVVVDLEPDGRFTNARFEG